MGNPIKRRKFISLKPPLRLRSCVSVVSASNQKHFEFCQNKPKPSLTLSYCPHVQLDFAAELFFAARPKFLDQQHSAPVSKQVVPPPRCRVGRIKSAAAFKQSNPLSPPHSLFLKVPILSQPFIFHRYLSDLIRSPAAPRAASSLVSFISGPTPINSSWRQRKPTEWSSTVPWRTPRTTKNSSNLLKPAKR